MEPISTRVLGAVAREIKKDFPKIASLASEVL
jgi:ribosomal protein L14